MIFYGFTLKPDMLNELGTLIPPLEIGAWSGIVSAGLLAFFAFVGFEDIANIAEEVKHPRRTMPLAIFFTLVLSTLIYFVVVSVIVLVVPMDKLVNSSAPLALVFESSGRGAAGLFSAIAIVATLNGILIQMIMASRILYGLASQKSLPEWIGEVHPVTRTPLNATILVVSIVLTLAVLIPIGQLAEYTSITVLLVFSLVNLALIKLKSDKSLDAADYFETPGWIPYVGFVSSVCLLLSGLL